jgi:hypothetical protein
MPLQDTYRADQGFQSSACEAFLGEEVLIQKDFAPMFSWNPDFLLRLGSMQAMSAVNQ